MESQFGKIDVPFYTGRLVGLRSFDVTPQGELTGVTYKGRWKDGENQAKCALHDETFYEWEGPEYKKKISHDPTHQVASMGCSCGYYAYFDGNDNEFQHGVNVEAVIEAWGKITIGEKGFRAAKARIVALVIPREVYPSHWLTKALHRLECSAKWYASHGWSYPYTANDNGCDLPLFPYPALMETIISRYPTAKIFDSQEAAIDAFPLTPVEVAREIVGMT